MPSSPYAEEDLPVITLAPTAINPSRSSSNDDDSDIDDKRTSPKPPLHSPDLDEKDIGVVPYPILINDPSSVASSSSLAPRSPPVVPWRYKWLALLAVVFLPVGQVWTDAALGPLKNTLRKELGINNTQYGVIDSASGIINCVCVDLR